MHIKDFAAQTGLSTDTLRYYEKEGLLQPARDANGYRNYGTRDVDWITFILRLKAMGVPLARIKEYACLRHRGDSTIPARYAILAAHQEILAAKQQELAAHQAYLAQKLAHYRTLMHKDGGIA